MKNIQIHQEEKIGIIEDTDKCSIKEMKSMKKSKHEFVFQSRLQRIFYVLSILAGGLIVPQPVAILSNYLLYSDNPADWLLAVLLALGMVLTLSGLLIGAKIGMLWVSHGSIELYSDHATLHYGSKTVQLEMNEFSIKTGMIGKGHYRQTYYDIRMDGHKVRFYEAVIKFRKPVFDASLDKAMMALMKSGLPALTREIAHALSGIQKRMKMSPKNNAERTLKIGDVLIYIRISTPEVFDNSPYYVDYSSCCATKSVPLCTCLVRELADPEHVVGDIGFADSEENETPKKESVLSKSVIVEGIALDERIGVE